MPDQCAVPHPPCLIKAGTEAASHPESPSKTSLLVPECETSFKTLVFMFLAELTACESINGQGSSMLFYYT